MWTLKILHHKEFDGVSVEKRNTFDEQKLENFVVIWNSGYVQVLRSNLDNSYHIAQEETSHI